MNNDNRFHRQSIRLQGYDYSQEGLYFITICTNGRAFYFGEISTDLETNRQKVFLNDAGTVADNCWREIPNHFPNVKLHEYVIMPNHVHGIIEIMPAGIENFQSLQQIPPDPLINRLTPHLKPESKKNKFQKIISRSIGSIVRGYKIGVTKWFNENTNIKPVWQRNYFERIIRDERSYQNISRYIDANPAHWKEDEFFKS